MGIDLTGPYWGRIGDDGGDAGRLVHVEIDGPAVPAAVELIGLFTRVIDLQAMSLDRMVVGPCGDGRVRLLTPRYLTGAFEDIAALVALEGRLSRGSEDLADDLVELAGAINAMWIEAPDMELPVLTETFEMIGIPIAPTEPFGRAPA